MSIINYITIDGTFDSMTVRKREEARAIALLKAAGATIDGIYPASEYC